MHMIVSSDHRSQAPLATLVKPGYQKSAESQRIGISGTLARRVAKIRAS